MKREDIFEELNRITDPVKDYQKVLANFHYTHYFLMDKYKKVLSAYDLSPAQSNVLGILLFHQPQDLSLEEVKELVLEPNSDVSRTVTRLCEKGFAVKVVNPENRRKVLIRPTPAGGEVYSRIAADRRLTVLTAGLSLEEARAFVKILARLREADIGTGQNRPEELAFGR